MNRVTKFVAPMAALVMALAFSYAVRAADDQQAAAATGTVTVTVTKDGKPIEGASVRILKPRVHGATTAQHADQSAADDTKPASSKMKNPPVAEGKTDKDGKLTLEKVPAGEYNVTASLKSEGYARQKLTVKAGETADVELKLKARTPAGAAPAKPDQQ
jgi:prealbumin domain-containing protein